MSWNYKYYIATLPVKHYLLQHYLPTNVAQLIVINVTSIVSISFDNKEIRYIVNCHILCTFLLVIIILFAIALCKIHHAKNRQRNNILTNGNMTLLKLKIFILIIFYWMNNHMKIFWFMTFYRKIWLVEGGRCIRDYNRSKYLALFCYKKHNAIFNRIKSLVRLKIICFSSQLFENQNWLRRWFASREKHSLCIMLQWLWSSF